ncbi:hypothetical protein ACF0H5_014486 [Mactra antiquata]
MCFPVVTSAVFAALTCEDKCKIEEPDASRLSREYLIKSSSITTAENAIILLTQTALALQQAEFEYKEALLAVAFLIEFKLSVLGNAQEEARIWDLILQGRDLVSSTKKKRDDLDILFKSTVNLVNISAEVLFMTDADVVGYGANERLVMFERMIRDEREKSLNAEEKLQTIELKSIDVEGKYAEEHAEELDKELQAVNKQYQQQNSDTMSENSDAVNQDIDNVSLDGRDNFTGVDKNPSRDNSDDSRKDDDDSRSDNDDNGDEGKPLDDDSNNSDRDKLKGYSENIEYISDDTEMKDTAKQL